jgi:hypothetical protein
MHLGLFTLDYSPQLGKLCCPIKLRFGEGKKEANAIGLSVAEPFASPKPSNLKVMTDPSSDSNLVARTISSRRAEGKSS